MIFKDDDLTPSSTTVGHSGGRHSSGRRGNGLDHTFDATTTLIITVCTWTWTSAGRDIVELHPR
jgi:hypothetical protein